ncbi:sulfurtransferase [Niveibacterium sp. SC-1]|uniref:sulfurtransferase n=1 Tax=Niveibacterium sp. SC-1 TaxID=3135646 RepID=UPI00311FEE36
MDQSVLNIASYRFVTLDALEELRIAVRDAADAAQLRGTVLLAEEGINLFLAGPSDAVRGFLAWLERDPRLAGLTIKESWSATQPFKRLRVKIKREIIRMDHPAIRPEAGRAPAVSPETLERWLDAGADDEGRPVVMLDTRNAFEVDFGRFRNAIDWRIDKFTEFPRALQAHREALAGKTVVSYCTGGIRCEKAALLAHEQGLDNVVQLEGGILAYFERTQSRHFDGTCFVFDEREALDPTLRATQA